MVSRTCDYFHQKAISWTGQEGHVGALGNGTDSLTKMFITVDHDINVHDMDEVIWAMTTRTDPKRDPVFIENAPTDTLNPSSPLLNLGSKVGIDATTKWQQEGFNREIQVLAEVDEETQKYSTRDGMNTDSVSRAVVGWTFILNKRCYV